MTPESLTLRGFIGIQDGCGRDEISIDLQNMPMGLIGIIGPNGKGKSTIIDNMHPYRLMPSRCEGKYSPSSFSFFDHLVPGKANKLFFWRSYDGRRFKTDLTFHTKSKKSDCFLFEWIGGNWEPFRTDDGTIIVDGKTDNYDRAVEYLLGSAELFFSSRFLAQSRRPLSTYGNSDMKMLLSEMLSIEKFKATSKRASEVSELLNRELERRQVEHVRLTNLKNGQEKLKLDLSEKEVGISKLKHDKVNFEGEIERSIERLRTLNESTKSNAEKLERAKTVRTRIEKVQSDLSQKRNLCETSRASKLVSIEQVKKQISSFQKLIDEKSKVEFAVAKLDEKKIFLAKSETDHASVRSKLAEATAKKHRKALMETELLNVQNSGAASRSNLETIWLQTRVISEVPCAAMAINSQCKLLSVAHEAHSKIPKLEAELNKYKSKYRNQKKELDDLVLENMDLDQLEKTLKLGEDQLKVLRKEVLELTDLASKMNQILAAEKEFTASTQLLVSLEEQMAVDMEQAKLQLEKLESERDACLEELKSFESADLTTAVVNEQKTLESLKSQLLSKESQIELEVRAQTTLQIEVGQTEEKLLLEPKLLSCINTISTEIAYWKQLSIGFGNNGLIALCIDDAGPTLSDLVNQLLDCYGSQYSIEILTQVTTGNGSVKEGFEILVHDSHMDNVKKLDYMSGGQKVYINDCLCRGIALYLGQTGVNTCKTLFSDETDGALDIERKRQFMKMKHKVLELSGCEREFFISHTPDCVELADGVIDLSLM